MSYITDISKTSPFFGKLKNGDTLVSVNGHKINDILDYMYHTAADDLSVCVLRDGKELTVSAKNKTGHPGLTFDSFLMDEHRSCKNKCVFCFIDQLPKHMRDTMYYKDDDFRLSLLQGNYVTLTNLTPEDVDRICDLRVSPLNVSVHATDGDVRVRMMKNPNARNIMQLLERFSEAGINLRCQIVLCKGYNDGDILKKSLADLKALFPAVSSVSVVPVGLSRFRDGLEPLVTFNAEECADVIDIVDSFGDACLDEYGTRIFYSSDEFYVTSGRPVPDYDYYEEFEQLEDGVGMLTSFIDEFDSAVDGLEKCDKKIKLTFVSGMIMRNTLPERIEKLKDKLTGLDADINFIRNDYFGENVTVTGLITGTDIIAQLKDKELGNAIILPSVMLRDDKFLDDVSVSDVEKALGVRVEPIPCDGVGAVEAISAIVLQ
ncbi:MAG: DUF512 domain-containing protein [Clostridia bacterium]|nr:DUF512 domain-containing protein [Clostridia bacterium]